MKVASHSHVIYGLAASPPWVVNAGFTYGSEVTLVIDAGWNRLSARTIHGYARCAKPDNTLLLLNTEPHSDHMGGNCFFRDENIPIYGHPGGERHDDEWEGIQAEFNDSVQDAARRKRFEAKIPFKGTRFVNPDRLVTDEAVIDLGGISAHIIPTPGHTPQNISVFEANDGVLFCGDCIIEGYRPNLEVDTLESRLNWKSSLETIRSLSPTIVVPGHGEAMKGDTIIKEIERHLRFLEAE